MNYLAHLYLAGEDEQLIVGNFLGDFVKGKIEHLELPEKLKQGIASHRKTDVLADECIAGLLKQENKQLQFQQRRYAGITFDLACDHFLARHWHSFHPMAQEEFSDSRIATLKNYQQHFTEHASKVLNRIEKYEWLKQYQNLDFLEQVFLSIHRRFPRENAIDQAFFDLADNYDALEHECLKFIRNISKLLIEDQNTTRV